MTRERERLMDVVPYRANGEAGLKFILAEHNVDAWVRANVADLVTEGFVRLVVTDHLTPDEHTIRKMGGRVTR
jgi:hypothetical protein